MLILTHSSFVGIPKTGSTWARNAIRRSMGVDRQIGQTHTLPCELTHILQHKPAFMFVRRPDTWYHSMWAFRMDQNWILPYGVGKTSLDEYCKAEKFSEFIDKVYDNCHGYCTTLFRMYLENPRMDYVGKQENLVEDLVMFLKLFKEPFNEKLLRETPRKNVSTIKPSISKKTRSKIEKMDGEIYERFAYA